MIVIPKGAKNAQGTPAPSSPYGIFSQNAPIKSTIFSTFLADNLDDFYHGAANAQDAPPLKVNIFSNRAYNIKHFPDFYGRKSSVIFIQTRLIIGQKVEKMQDITGAIWEKIEKKAMGRKPSIVPYLTL